MTTYNGCVLMLVLAGHVILPSSGREAAVASPAFEGSDQFGPAKQSVESLCKFVASCGYQVKETGVV